MQRAEPAVLAAIADALTDVVLVIGEDDTVLFRRRSPSRVLPVDGDGTYMGAPIFERIHPEDLPGVIDALARLRSGDVAELSMSCRIFDASDATVLHDQDFRAFDAREVPGVGGILIAATVRDTRRAFADQVHSDDFSLAGAAPVGLALVTTNGRIIFANEMLRTHVGLARRTALTATAVVGLHDLIDEAAATGKAQRTLAHRSLLLRTLACRLGDSGNIVLSTDDITAEVRADTARERSERTWRATLEHAPSGIAVVDVDGRFVEVNGAWTSITGHPADWLVGRDFADITHPDDVGPDRANVQRLLRGEQDRYRMQKRYVRPDGELVWVDLWVSVVRDEGGDALHFVSQIIDITEVKRAELEIHERELQLAHSATHDRVSGLPNRALVEAHVRTLIRRMARRTDDAAVLTVTIDGDHPDEAVAELAERVTAECRGGDIVGRFDGSFVVVADPVGADGDLEAMTERLRHIVSQPLTVGDGASPAVRVTARRVTAADTVESLLPAPQPAR